MATGVLKHTVDFDIESPQAIVDFDIESSGTPMEPSNNES